MPSDAKNDESLSKTPARRVFENALIWSAVALSIALLLVVVAGMIDLLPDTLAVQCRLTLTYMCAILVFVAAGYTAVDVFQSRTRS
jgi:hypothetical protein